MIGLLPNKIWRQHGVGDIIIESVEAELQENLELGNSWPVAGGRRGGGLRCPSPKSVAGHRALVLEDLALRREGYQSGSSRGLLAVRFGHERGFDPCQPASRRLTGSPFPSSESSRVDAQTIRQFVTVWIPTPICCAASRCSKPKSIKAALPEMVAKGPEFPWIGWREGFLSSQVDMAT